MRTESWTAVAPSNIAFVKYWGKRDPGLQWPANDSLSMTLTTSRTITTARRHDSPMDIFQFADQPAVTSATHPQQKIFRHLSFLRQQLGTTGHLIITSQNTFPTGCGIASSASGFAALTIAATAAWTGHADWNELALKNASRDALAHWARQGSGSAGRSLFGGFVRWDAGASPQEQRIHQIATADHWALSDVIVVLSDEEKSMSSSEAHLAAWGSPLFTPRLSGLPAKMKRIIDALERKDLERLGPELESEALDMHAVAMTGNPPAYYFTNDTVRFLSWVRDERGRGALPAYFTIDAGPNVHLICETKDVDTVTRRLQKEWPRVKTIVDRVGTGPTVFQGVPTVDPISTKN